MSPRKRATHYALMDSAFAADRKFVRLAARASIPIEFAAAVGVYWIILADARRAKSPDVDWADYEEYAPQVELLQSVGLLTDGGFPADAFDKWAPAYQSPYDRSRSTQGNTGVHNGTHGNEVSVQFSSPPGVGGAGEGAPPQGSFMGFRRKATASLDDVRRQEAEAFQKCANCGVLGHKHPASGDHPFRAATVTA